MNLPFLKSKKEEKEYFLALILSIGEIRGILFEKSESGLIILGAKKEEFDGLLESLSSEKLVEISDTVISDVEKNLPIGVEFENAIFVVPHSWIVEGKIIKEHLVKLKNLCDFLKLTPMGFIVSIEAIVAFLHKKEGVPVTAVFVEIGKKHISLSIVKNGSVVYIADEEIKEDAISSVEEILSVQDATEILPSKMVLLNYDNAKKLEQVFLSHQWSKKLQFLHIPKVEVLDHNIESQAVISGVATQMGFSNAEESEGSTDEKATSQLEEMSEEDQIKNEISDGYKKPVALHFNGDSVGFFQDVDILKEKQEKKIIPEEKESKIYDESQIAIVQKQKEHETVREREIGSILPKFNIGIFSDFANNILSGKKNFLYPIIAVGILIACIFGYYLLFEKVELIIVLDKQEVKKDLSVTFSKDKSTSAKDSIIHIATKTIEENGKEEKSTTGEKETGEKAKGEVTILSSQNKETIIEKGTVLVSSNSLKFILDSDVKIASSSGLSDIKSEKEKVTADEIGKEYNLPSNTKFSVGGFDKSSVEAKSDSAFSGGSKKEIKVVSQDDIDSLTTKVLDNLSKKAIEKAVSQKEENEEVLTFPLGYTFDEKVFSKELDEQADLLTLSAALSYDLGFYNKEEIGVLAKEISGDGVSKGYKYSKKDSKVIVSDVVENDNGKITGKISFSSIFLPELPIGTLQQKIIGKSTNKAEEILSSDGVKDVQIVYVRSLPLFPRIIPFNKKNITITTKID